MPQLIHPPVLSHFLYKAIFVSDESEIKTPSSVDSSASCTSSTNTASGNESTLSLPEWMTIGEHILLRRTNYSGTIAFIGTTEFASGVWIGIELDAPLGKRQKTF